MSELAPSAPVRQKVKRFESRKYLEWVRSQRCVIHDTKGCHPHHIWGMGHRDGQKASDLFTFALSPREHTTLHADVKLWESLHGSQWKFVALTLARYVMERLVK